MISATKEKLASFFLGTIQYEVPFFQRGYEVPSKSVEMNRRRRSLPVDEDTPGEPRHGRRHRRERAEH
jgi:hypothetical protein